MSARSPLASANEFTTPGQSPIAGRDNAFPFPNQDRQQKYRPRRGSVASVSSLGSVGGSLDFPLRKGNPVREISQNAISSLIQPPIVRTGLVPHTLASAAAAGYRAPTARDIPPVALTNIPHVPPETFKEYLAQIGPLFESFARGRTEVEQASWLKKDKDLERTDRFAEQLDRNLSRDGSISPTFSRQSSSAVFSPLDSPRISRRRSSGQLRRNRNEPTPLSTIPAAYFDEDFHLENPRTFDVVSERAEIVRQPAGQTTTADATTTNGNALPPRKALASNAILQEKLSWYMDTVEVHLINSISTASGGFFAALGSLKELQTEAEESIAKIQGLREDLRRLDNEIAGPGLEVAAKRRRRENVRKLGRATAQVQAVVDAARKADDLAEGGSFDAAADEMDRLGRLICGQPEPGGKKDELIDLRPLKALQGMDSGFQALQARIGSGYAQNFTNVLMDDLRRHKESVPAQDTLKRWSRVKGVSSKYLETSNQFREQLSASWRGLARVGSTSAASTAYRDAVNKEMKNLIRKYLPSSSDDDADSMISTSTRGGKRVGQQEKSTILARNLRALDADDAESLLVNVYTAVGETLRRVSTQTKLLLDVTSSIQVASSKTSAKSGTEMQHNGQNPVDQAPTNGPDDSSAKSDDFSQTLDLSSLLGHAVDTAQTQIIKVLKVRNEQAAKLSKAHFLRYITLNRLFADECETVSGRAGVLLRGVINTQISAFMQNLGTAETERIAAALDSDSWNAEDFNDKDDEVLQRLLKSVKSDPPEWIVGAAPLWEPVPAGDPIRDVSATTNGTTNGATSKTQTKPARIDDEKFILVSSAISLLPSVESFLALTATLPSMTPQVSTALLEVLRTFNSRSCQLILGAGAIHSAGLKNITTKHLALSSQALSFVIALIPYIRECIRRHVPAGQTTILTEFDKTKRLYQDHQVGIHDKVVDIITSRSLSHVKSMRAIDFAGNSVKPTGDDATEAKPSPYMDTLTRETLTLQRVLGRHMSEVSVSSIMKQIFANYHEHWTKAFQEVEVKNIDAGQALLRDAECLNARLGKLDGFEETGKEILAIVQKRIAGLEATEKPSAESAEKA